MSATKLVPGPPGLHAGGLEAFALGISNPSVTQTANVTAPALLMKLLRVIGKYEGSFVG